MPTTTTNFGFGKPVPFSLADSELWAYILNTTIDSMDTVLATRPLDYDFAGYSLINAKVRDSSNTMVTVASSGSSYVVDYESAHVFHITLTSNCAITFSNWPATGSEGGVLLYLVQGGSGGYTVTWPASIEWPSSIEPTITPTVGAEDVIQVRTYDGGTTLKAFNCGQNFG